MNFKITALLTGLSVSLFGCDNSSSSPKDPSEPVAQSQDPSPPQPGDAVAATGSTATEEATPADAIVKDDPEGGDAEIPELQDAIKLNSNSLEYSRLQYDCGDIAAPIDATLVEARLIGAKSFQTLAATIPARDQALVKITAIEGLVACTYRALFSVNKAFTEVTFASSQSLDVESFTACASAKQSIDLGLGSGPVAFDYDKKFIRWVALHIPQAMQSSPICATGKLRAVFAGATL